MSEHEERLELTEMICRLHDKRRKLEDDVERLRAEVERLRSWIEGDCICPCCQETRACLEGCTFAEDCPNEAERMNEARAVLFNSVDAASRGKEK